MHIFSFRLMRPALLSAICILVMSACVHKTSSKTRSGYKFEHALQTDGKKVKTNDIVLFTYEVYVDDTLGSKWIPGDNYEAFRMPTPDSINFRGNVLAEAFELMGEGDSCVMVVPASVVPNLPKEVDSLNAMLKYHLKIRHIMNDEEFKEWYAESLTASSGVSERQRTRETGKRKEVMEYLKKYTVKQIPYRMYKTPAGMEYFIIKEGDGPVARYGQSVEVDFFGMELRGEDFDNSFKLDKPAVFELAREKAIGGLIEGFTRIKAGSVGVLVIPPQLAYGSQGIPDKVVPDATIFFYFELHKVLE